ncbi:Ig-like domain-containing protein [Anaerobutyricum hallii]|uniref:Ig-like domain-containing protein n=1 Tax=Anaerobutyricum hallii TaxID=39488 RepID=UPI0026DBA128|nr:Ig-like domain-containing protein [Anaerobutyricum hallii]
MRKISSVIMACAMCLSMAVVGTVAPQVAVQAEETATAELKEAPTETPALEKDFGYEWYLIQYSEYTANSENTKSWMEKITSIKVNDAEPYTKVDNKFLMKEDTFRANVSMVNITIGNKEFTKDTNKVVISAEGYKDLVLEVGKDYKKVAIHTKHTGGTATCTKKAVCEFCGAEYGECASHNYGDKYESDGTHHWKKCQNEGCDSAIEKEAHKGGEATTTKRAVCEVCGAEYGDLKKEDPKPAEKPDKKTVKAKKVVVNKKRIVLKKGKKVKLKAKLKPANATEKVTFKSSNKKVAKVTKNGVVKAVKKGKCKITVKTASGKKAVVKVTVK